MPTPPAPLSPKHSRSNHKPHPSNPIPQPKKVFFKFRPEVPQSHKDLFAHRLKTLKALPSVKDRRLIVGGPSITQPAERSKGFQYALLSYHRDREALEAYQASDEHHAYVGIRQFLWRGFFLWCLGIVLTGGVG